MVKSREAVAVLSAGVIKTSQAAPLDCFDARGPIVHKKTSGLVGGVGGRCGVGWGVCVCVCRGERKRRGWWVGEKRQRNGVCCASV